MRESMDPEFPLNHPRPQPRIAFVVMSAVHSQDAIDELANVLAPHLLLVHHDFGQTPDFSLAASNVRFVPNPKRTGWACWGFCEGIFHALRHAVQHHSFDYLQLLSPTCLPIKPLRAFEEYLVSSDCDANFDCIDLLENRDALMSVGYRAFAPEHSFRHRFLGRLSSAYYGGNGSGEREQVAGVQLRTGAATDARGRLKPVARVALHAMRASSHPRIGRHIFDRDFAASFGSVWFGARREVVARMLERFDDSRVRHYFSRLRIADEFLVPTLLRCCSVRRGPANLLVNTFVDANPAWFEEVDFDRLRKAREFFARKFRDDRDDPIRRRVLDELVCRSDAPQGAGTSTATIAPAAHAR